MADLQASSLVLFNIVAFLVPAGLALLAVGAAEEERAERVATTAVVALASAAIGYYLMGFAVQFGGAAFVSGMPGLVGLTAEWSPLDLTWGPGWGVIGLRGFALHDAAYNPDAYLLFLASLPSVYTAVLVALLALSRHVRQILLFGVGLLISSLIYPLYGNWVWGGGWLANLGLNLQQGHGFVDVAGSSTIFLLGTLVALSAYLLVKPTRAIEEGPASLPPIHFPLFMILGAVLALLGWAGLILGNPLLGEQVSTPIAVLNLFLSASAAATVVSLYSWFVTGQPNAMATARGIVAGLVAASASCAFVPAWAALVIGAAAGILYLASVYAWDRVLRWEDPSASAATYGIPGVWGLVALSVFADGRWGVGWNNVGVQEYLGISGQGISGFLLAGGYQPAGPVQLQAQLTGLAALLAVALLLPWVVFRGAIWLRTVVQPAPAESTECTQAELAIEEESDSSQAGEAGDEDVDAA